MCELFIPYIILMGIDDINRPTRDWEYEETFENSSHYLPFFSLLWVEKGTFYNFFRNELPSFGKIKRWETSKQRVFKSYFDIRNNLWFSDTYPYAHLYSFQGNLLFSPIHKHERERFFKDMFSFIIKNSNVSSLFASEKMIINDKFSLRLDASKIEHISLNQSSEWFFIMERILIFIIIQFFKKNPATFSKFFMDYYSRHEEEILQQIEEKRAESKKKSVVSDVQEGIKEVLENEEPHGRDFFRKTLRPDEKNLIDYDDDWNIVAPSRSVSSQKHIPEDWREETFWENE